MSSMEILERFNDASRDSIDIEPKVRKKGIDELVRLFYDAPELKISIESKLDQLSGDADEGVARYANQMLQRVRSGTQYRPYYAPTPSRRPSTTSGTTAGTGQPPSNAKSIVANIVCCVIMIVVYFVISFFVF